MTQLRHYELGCKTKHSWRRRGEAVKALRKQQTAGRGDHTLRPYRCVFCGLYHLGHDRKPTA